MKLDRVNKREVIRVWYSFIALKTASRKLLKKAESLYA